MDPQRIHDRRWWTLGVLCLSLTVIGLDNTILNVALPTLVRDLGATSSQLQWIVDSYVLVFAGLLLTAGSIGDRFGRKLALFAGMAVFLGASVLCAFADTAAMLITARALMGIGGALIMPSTLSIITNVFPPQELGKAIGIWAGVSGLGIVIGPLAGGWLLEHFWWGSVFLINVPFIVAAMAGSVLIPESKDPVAAKFDPAGAVLSILGLSVLVYAIIEAPAHGWLDPRTFAEFALAFVLLGHFMAWERRAPHPMLELGFFRNPRFSAASLSITMVFFAMFGSVFMNTQYLQFVLGYTPLQAGVRVLPVVTMVPAARASDLLTKRFGTKRVVAAGLGLVAVALFVLSTVSLGTGYGLVALSLALLGLGMGSAMAPATASIMASLPRAKAGVGSAMNDTTRMVGGALGVAIAGSVLNSVYAHRVVAALPTAPAEVIAAAKSSVGAALAVAERVPAPFGPALARVAQGAFVDGMGVALLVTAFAALLGAAIAVLFLPATGEDAEELEVAAGEPFHEPAGELVTVSA